jgi:hypothetical protein
VLLSEAGRARIKAEQEASFELHRAAVATGYAEAMVKAGAWKAKRASSNRVKASNFDQIDAWIDHIGTIRPGRVN